MRFRNTETDNILEVESAFIIKQMKDNPKYVEITNAVKATGEEVETDKTQKTDKTNKTVAMITLELKKLNVDIPKKANKATLEKLLEDTLSAKKVEEEGAVKATGEEVETDAETGQIGEI